MSTKTLVISYLSMI